MNSYQLLLRHVNESDSRSSMPFMTSLFFLSHGSTTSISGLLRSLCGLVISLITRCCVLLIIFSSMATLVTSLITGELSYFLLCFQRTDITTILYTMYRQLNVVFVLNLDYADFFHTCQQIFNSNSFLTFGLSKNFYSRLCANGENSMAITFHTSLECMKRIKRASMRFSKDLALMTTTKH